MIDIDESDERMDADYSKKRVDARELTKSVAA